MEFVEDWDIIQILGEGAYGEVKLLVHRITGEAVAVKIVHLQKHKDAAECVKRETCIHKMLRHPNIIRFYGKRQEPNEEYIFMEYAAGGELFNKIEPDIGMPAKQAQSYMLQLLNGVEYLHQKGIAHRDLKPENLLLDEAGNLKITDFGLATVFRLHGRERILDKRCGTLPYIAPEVLTARYKAIPADLWSCGIVFVAMMTGELPWDEPVDKCMEFHQWKVDNYLTLTPWSKLGNCALSLARKILNLDPDSRPSIENILQQRWMQLSFGDEDTESTLGEVVPKKIKRQTSLGDSENETPLVTLSQPLPHTNPNPPKYFADLLKTRQSIKCFSQPTQNEDLIINGSQVQFTQSVVTQNNFHHLIKRMTRFFVTPSCEKAITVLCAALDKHHYTWNIDTFGAVAISTVDRRKMELMFKANIIDMDGKILLDFRLCKGCGLEFKKHFLKLKNVLSEIILNES